MSEWRDMERRHATEQLRKMEAAQAESRASSDRARQQIRRYQRKIHLYEWYLQRNDESVNSLESMARAVKQIGGLIEFERRRLAVADEAGRHEAESVNALRAELARIDRWKRLAARLEEWFWPVTILRAITSQSAIRNQ